MNLNQIAASSDDEFLKNFDQFIDSVPEPEQITAEENQSEVPVVPAEEPAVEPTEPEAPPVEPEAPVEGEPSPVDPKPETPSEAGTENQPETSSEEPPANTENVSAQVDQYKSFYERVMAPFKASGKTIQLKDPEEAFELIKKGVDYTRKTMEIAADKKFLVMLEKNQLKDEAKLSFLIDLANKNPEAIKKLVADAGIDPLDIDTSAPVSYAPGNHSVSDAEIRFTETLTEVNSVPEGQELVQKIFTNWDQVSQGHMWKDPEALRVLLAQKQSGVYDIVEGEVERRRLLGQIPPTTPYLDAYRLVGMELGQAGAFNHLPAFQAQVPPTQVQRPAPQAPIATRVATPNKPAVDPTVRAAAPTRPTAPVSSKPTLDDIANLSDEEFLKRFPTL